MTIVYRPLKYLFGYGYLLLLFIGGGVIGIFQAYKFLNLHYISYDSIFMYIYFITCVFFLWFLYTLLKCNYYIIELNDNSFKHKILFSKEYKYSEIKDIYIIELKTRGAETYNILKIKMKAKIIRLRIDKLNNNELDDLMDIMRTKTRRKVIVTKDKRKKLFPWI